MISTTMQGGRWLLVSATTGDGINLVPGAYGSKAEKIELYWTGLAWSECEGDGKGFATQGEALAYRTKHLQELKAKLG